jgi:23S rRNA (pseudouridine1915-N3)-methyltransferase
MRLVIAAIGKLKDAEERGMVERYAKRLGGSGKNVGLGPLEAIEFSESRLPDASARKAEEAARLLKATIDCTLRIALDEDGRSYASDTFAKLLGKHASSGTKACAFLIGGPDGHGDDALKACDFKLSLGAMTFPHGLARVVLVEQLYRTVTILSGHPYHRA